MKIKLSKEDVRNAMIVLLANDINIAKGKHIHDPKQMQVEINDACLPIFADAFRLALGAHPMNNPPKLSQDGQSVEIWLKPKKKKVRSFKV